MTEDELRSTPDTELKADALLTIRVIRDFPISKDEQEMLVKLLLSDLPGNAFWVVKLVDVYLQLSMLSEEAQSEVLTECAETIASALRENRARNLHELHATGNLEDRVAAAVRAFAFLNQLRDASKENAS